jgi:hypothetical protein
VSQAHIKHNLIVVVDGSWLLSLPLLVQSNKKIGSVGLHCQNAIKQTRVSQLDRVMAGHNLSHGLGHPCAAHQTRP